MLTKEQIFTVLKSVFPNSKSPLELIDTIFDEASKRNFSNKDLIRTVEYNKYGPVFPSKSANLLTSKIKLW